MGEFLDQSKALQATMLAIGLAPSALLGVLGFMFRERLKHALARALNAHTEELKLQAQREIEAYKVSLIASIERQKAHAELKKAIAIKHATLEYEALVTLHARISDVASSVLSSVQLVPSRKPSTEERISEYEKLDKKLDELGEAIDAAHLFVAPDRSIALLRYRGGLMELARNHVLIEAAEAVSKEAIKSFHEDAAPLRNFLRDRVADLVKLTESD